MNIKIAIAILSFLLPFGANAAPARAGECSGILHNEKGSLEFGGRPGETEAICVVADSEQKKVMSTCSAGQFCRVNGLTAPCRESGECTEISRIRSVTRR
jgi:hypothetical protein